MKHSVEEVELKNGAKGLLIDIPTASVMDTRVQFRAGIRYARTPDLYEIAHVVEHLSFGANAKYHSEAAYEADFTKNGAYHNAWTSDFSVCYETECADFEWDRILNLKRCALTTPRFNEEELKSEKGNVRAELTGYLNDYNRLLWPRLQKAIGESSPTFPERIKTINNIELKDIREHYRRTHTARNMRFIIAGKINRSRRREIIHMLEDWELKPGERFIIPRDELHSATPTLIRRKDASNITFGFSYVSPERLDPVKAPAMGCLNHILTGTMYSKIFGEARKRGLVYNLWSGLSNNENISSWDYEGEVNHETAEELFTLIEKQLTKVLGGELKDEDIAAAKSYGLGRYQMGAQTVAHIADYYSDTYFQSEEIEKYDHVPDIINNLQKSDLIELARAYASTGISAFAAVSSTDKATINSLASHVQMI
ncbi:insulinase family protein [Candidatus Saccharibacteria bacterium]|nr:insulinase family protein [Candidatus Saccharibacteria bacterium]